MADVPRDPRQLARDILAGKISIEELAREQQRRRAGGVGPAAGGRPPMARVPDRVPLPRPVAPPPRPVVRQAPAARQGGGGPQFPQQQQRPVARPVQRRVLTVPPPPVRQPAVRAVVTAPATPSAVQSAQTAAPTVVRQAAPAMVRALNIAGIVRSRTALRQGILLAEILGKPVALRDES